MGNLGADPERPFAAKVIGGATDVVRPMFLPGDRLVYARRGEKGFSWRRRGSMVRASCRSVSRPEARCPTTCLRMAGFFLSQNFRWARGRPRRCSWCIRMDPEWSRTAAIIGTARWGGRQLVSGDVVFTHGTSLARFTSPLAHEVRVAAPQAEYAGAIAELESGEWLLSARPNAKASYAIETWKPGMAELRTVYLRAGENLVEPVLLIPRQRPNKHPSALHDWAFGNMLAMNVRESREGDLKALPARVQLETQDENSKPVVLGTAPVIEDGSFFVQAPGDKPIRFALLDSKGAVMRRERGWFWIHSGEQRVRTGCHTGPERAFENRVPAVLLHTTTPVDLTGAAAQSARGADEMKLLVLAGCFLLASSQSECQRK